MNKETLTALLGALLAGTLSAENLTREQLDKLLETLAVNPAPEAKKMPQALCYSPMPAPTRAEYVCPQCGEKTVYSWDAKATKEDNAASYQTMLAVQKLQYHRAKLAKLKELGLDASLDERAFCGVCKTADGFPDEKWALYLVVRLNDKTATTRLQHQDWDKLFAFLEGKDEWVTDSIGGSTEPLKPELPRIRVLLGLDEKPTEETPDIEPQP